MGSGCPDLVRPGFIEFAKDGTGQFGFVAVDGWMTAGGLSDGRPFTELAENGVLAGHLFIHMVDESGVHTTPFTKGNKRDER